MFRVIFYWITLLFFSSDYLCAKEISEAVCVPAWLQSHFQKLNCSKQNKKLTRELSCSDGFVALKIKSECLTEYHQYQQSVCIDLEAFKGFQLWSANKKNVLCDETTGIKTWKNSQSGCGKNQKRIYAETQSPEVCKKILEFKDQSYCEPNESAQFLLNFCPIQSPGGEDCKNKTKIWKSFSGTNESSCEDAVDAFHSIRCLNQENQLFWEKECKNDPRRVPKFDQDFCQGGAAVLAKDDSHASTFCNQLATQTLETHCANEAAKVRAGGVCSHVMSLTPLCPQGEYLVIDTPDSACLKKIGTEQKVDRSLISSCLPIDKLDKEKELLRNVFEKFVESQTEYNSKDIDHLSETLDIINASEGLTDSEKARLRSIFIHHYFAQANKGKKWDHLSALIHLMDHQKNWHTRAQVLYEYTKAVGYSKHQLARLQNELLLTKTSNPKSDISKYFTGADVNACNYIMEVMVGAYPLTLDCSRKFDRGTLMAQCEIEKKSVKKLNKKDHTALTKNLSGFYSGLSTLLQQKGPLVYCGSEHCAMFVIEEDTVYVYDGTVTPSRVERDKFIRRTVLKNNPGVLKFHYKQLTLNKGKLYSFKAI